MLWVEVKIVHSPCQVPGNIQIPFDECPVDRQFGRRRGHLLRARTLDLLPLGLKVPLHAIHADRECIFERQTLRVFRQHGTKISPTREIHTHEDPQPDSACQSEPLIVRISDSYPEWGSVK